MATLASLKEALRNAVSEATSAPHPTQRVRTDLTEEQYRDGFNILLDGYATESTGPASIFPSNSYKDFIIPKLSQVFESFLRHSQSSEPVKLNVLEIGPGPKTVLSQLPTHLRCLVKQYVCLEPNTLYWQSMCNWARQEDPKDPEDKTFPCLTDGWENDNCGFGLGYYCDTGKLRTFDLILSCHSMYGMRPKDKLIEKAAELLSDDGVVVVFHRDDGSIDFGVEDDKTEKESALVCHSTASFPTGAVGIANDEMTMNIFGPFIAGFNLMNPKLPRNQRGWQGHVYPWHIICRKLGRREGDRLYFSAPDVMRVFTRHARTAVGDLMKRHIPLAGVRSTQIKNREARLYKPAAILRPTSIEHVQEAVRWALQYKTRLTILGGGHSGHCLSSNIVALDMRAFNKTQISGQKSHGDDQLIIAGVGCTAGDVVKALKKHGLTVPLGSRPSVGAGLWLQGGIGRLSRLYGLSCDSIVGAVVVSVKSGEILCVGYVPPTEQPAGSRILQPGDEDHDDLLWAIKGAGTNFGIVVSIVFKANSGPKSYTVQNWTAPLHCETRDAQRQQLYKYDQLVASKLPQSCSADAYLYWINGKFCLVGVTAFETQGLGGTSNDTTTTINLGQIMGPADSCTNVNNMELFDADLYMTNQMHGGHGRPKTSSFKRCLFFDSIGDTTISDLLINAMSEGPTSLCYIHVLHGGGAVSHVDANATAFGCRDWNYALVITGVWPRDQDGTDVARDVVAWVYKVAMELLPFSTGAYSADLGPDPRDAPLAVKAFGPNLPRLVRLKQKFDPHNILAYACPLKVPEKSQGQATTPKLVILVTGEEGAGKDYCASRFLSVFTRKGFNGQIASISDVTKKEYASANGADFDRLLRDRDYKEQHRPALTAFFQDQVRKRPQLPEKHFQSLIQGPGDVDVLFVTGMRDEAPVATLAHLVPESRVVDVRIEASEEIRRARRGGFVSTIHRDNDNDSNNRNIESNSVNDTATTAYRPTFIFTNNEQDTTSTGNPRSQARAQIELFAFTHFLPFLSPDLERFADVTDATPNFPRPGITFRHVLGIAEQPGGLDLCTSLLQKHLSLTHTANNPQSKNHTSAIVSCEAGGFIFASALASRTGVPLALIRKGGKIPPPVYSVVRSEGKSHISSLSSSSVTTPTLAAGESDTLMHGADDVDMDAEVGDKESNRIEIGKEVIRRIRDGGGSVVVVDDVLATGSTLCAALRLLVQKGGIEAETITVLVVAEFPAHRGRDLLRRKGFGMVDVRSLLVFGGL